MRSVHQRYWADYGVHLVDGGVDAILWAPEATRVEFCVLNRAGDAWVQTSYDLEVNGYGNWQAHIDGIRAGQHYGYRVHGPWDPENGHFFNPAKLLCDPYARIVEGEYHYGEAVLPYESTKNAAGKLEPVVVDGKWVKNEVDSAPFVPHSVVSKDLNGHHDAIVHPKVEWRNTVIYEAHVVGLTKCAPWLPEELRGTYAGLAHSETIKYLKELGVTTIELLPIHSKISEAHLLENELENYWGYSTLSFFAPNPSYATEEARRKGGVAVLDEVRGMVSLLHKAGIEVVLDVVYNHTCEESNAGAMLSYRGIANRQYYLHQPGNFGVLDDTTGCGNSLNFCDAHVVRLALDSLRYWANQIGIDGFRFDLMVTCARNENGFSPNHAFLTSIKNDPLLGNLKMIAEPWDLGIAGWRTGGFGFPFSEWNDSFRNVNRTFWVQDKMRMQSGYTVSSPQTLATKMAGSWDIFGQNPNEVIRGPFASVNYITAHDGFTLRDLVSYNEKHNQCNKENNADGTADNISYNHGVEGPSDDRKIRLERRRTMRNLLGMLLLSTGVPMITAGDEVGRTQKGNNNAYCQNSDISWIDWNLEAWQRDLLHTSKHLLWLRRSFPALHQSEFFTGEAREGKDVPDLCWFRANGSLFTPEAWANSEHRAFQAFFAAPNNGEENSNRDVLIVVNAHGKSAEISLPEIRRWERVWNSQNEIPRSFEEHSKLRAQPFSIQVFASIV
ncbi:MAG: glycogen debranching protein GlgX [Candidatus Ancillula sp.]|nr:glycogen debranching protein GlgX [Candidatus Ancillula sp.]